MTSGRRHGPIRECRRLLRTRSRLRSAARSRARPPGLCDRVCAILSESRAGVAFCDVAGLKPDAVTVEALARLQLGARRVGCAVRLLHASEELLDLVAFMGLTDVLPG